MSRSKDVQRWIKQRKAGMTLQQIADAAGVGYGTVYSALRKLSISPSQIVGSRDGRTHPAAYKLRNLSTSAELPKMEKLTAPEVEKLTVKPPEDTSPLTVGDRVYYRSGYPDSLLTLCDITRIAADGTHTIRPSAGSWK